eukprot:TRINITY_DN15872_c0_g1_i2.p1 TRINITY_DN15872_c0_g1~~TRINITY_DN15872_c0_g1_i2.p1  ORF type:complete len:425 (-),score=59.33 TRINITY_DN15872_c0_g1_i2:453-1667(-)
MPNDAWAAGKTADGHPDESHGGAHEDPTSAPRRHALAVAKASAGAIRFLCEDCSNAVCQLLFLCKFWDKAALGSRVFTVLSVCVGLVISLAGPLVEAVQARRFRRRSLTSQFCQEQGQQVAEDMDAVMPVTVKAEDGECSGETDRDPKSDEDDGVERHATEVERSSCHHRPVLKDVRCSQLLTGRTSSASKTAARRLLVAAMAFWTMMIVSPWAFPQGCGKDPPAAALSLFFVTSMSITLLELWVFLQTLNGYVLFKNLHSTFLKGFFLGHLNRFDTFTDVMFAGMLNDCDPITGVSIRDTEMHFPFGVDLRTIVIVVLVFGVFLCQCLPGLWLLAYKRDTPGCLPLALQFNNFSLLLALMDYEAYPDESAESIDVLKALDQLTEIAATADVTVRRAFITRLRF